MVGVRNFRVVLEECNLEIKIFRIEFFLFGSVNIRFDFEYFF